MADNFQLRNNVSAAEFAAAVEKLIDYLADDESRNFGGEPDHIYRSVYAAALGLGRDDLDSPDELFLDQDDASS